MSPALRLKVLPMRASSMHVCGKSGRVIVAMSSRRVFLPRLGSGSR